MNTGSAVVSAVVVLIILVVVFLIFREVFCWYWKINERVAILKDIKNLLQNTGRNASTGDKKLHETSDYVMSDELRKPVK